MPKAKLTPVFCEDVQPVEGRQVPFNFIVNMAPVAPENVRMPVYSDAEIKAIWSGVAELETLIIPDAIADKRREGSLVQIGQPNASRSSWSSCCFSAATRSWAWLGPSWTLSMASGRSRPLG